MKVKLSSYVSQFLVDHGITHAFTVTGGGAMHLNDSLGHQEGLTCVYNHHEQACAIAAESYARIHNKIAALCVTTGPGGCVLTRQPEVRDLRSAPWATRNLILQSQRQR